MLDHEGLIRRRDLPHIDVEGKPIFITACLQGSLSQVGLSKIRKYRDELNAKRTPPDMTAAEWEMKKHKLVFKLVDSLLDRASPVKLLEEDRLAKIVQDAFLHFADERYRLLAFVVMPSHHHWMFLPLESFTEELARSQMTLDVKKRRTPREVISHSIQSYTATQCNRLLGKTGAFWQTETFDHFARDEAETLRIIDYIEQNPVVAGLVKKPAEHRWSSAHLRQILGIQPGEAIPKIAVA